MAGLSSVGEQGGTGLKYVIVAFKRCGHPYWLSVDDGSPELAERVMLLIREGNPMQRMPLDEYQEKHSVYFLCEREESGYPPFDKPVTA